MSRPSVQSASAADMTASGVAVSLAGMSLTIYPLTLADLGSLERYIRAEFISTVRESLSGLPPKERNAEMALAYKHAGTIRFDSEEGSALLESADGIKQILYHSIRHGDSGFDISKLADLDVASMEGLGDIVEQIQRMTEPPEQPQAAGSGEGKATPASDPA